MNKDSILAEIGLRLRLIRLESGLSQDALARAMGRRFVAVSAWESGEADMTAADLAALVPILGCDVHWLLTGSRPPRTQSHPSESPLVRSSRSRRMTH
jgi:transcriptional regulator with XRE-family HTH domain